MSNTIKTNTSTAQWKMDVVQFAKSSRNLALLNARTASATVHSVANASNPIMETQLVTTKEQITAKLCEIIQTLSNALIAISLRRDLLGVMLSNVLIVVAIGVIGVVKDLQEMRTSISRIQRLIVSGNYLSKVWGTR